MGKKNSDWQIPLLEALFKKSIENEITQWDREQLEILLKSLAEEQKSVDIKDRLHFDYFLKQSKSGVSRFLNKLKPYFSEYQMSVCHADMKEKPPEKTNKKSASTPVQNRAEPVTSAIEIKLNVACSDASSVLSTLKKYVNERTGAEDFCRIFKCKQLGSQKEFCLWFCCSSSMNVILDILHEIDWVVEINIVPVDFY